MSFEYTDDINFDTIVVEQDNIEYWQRQFANRRELIASDLVADILYEYYDLGENECFYSAHIDGEELTFPILTRTDWTDVSFDPQALIDSMDVRYDTEYDRSFIWETSMQRAALTVDAHEAPVEFHVRDYVWNDPIYKIDTIRTTDDGFEFDVALTDYYTYVSRAIKLVEELFEALDYRGISPTTPTNQATDLLEFASDLPKRDYFAPDLNTMTADTGHHILGSLVTTIVEHDDEHYVAIMERSDTNVDFPATRGVAPSGAFTPWVDAEAECDYMKQLIRLVGEEMYAQHPPRDPSDDISPDWMLTDDRLADLYEELLAEDGGAHAQITGFGFNCLSAAPQVSALLYIEEGDYASSLYETVQEQSEGELSEGNVQFIPLEDAIESLRTEKWAPGAAASLIQSVRAASHELDLETDATII